MRQSDLFVRLRISTLNSAKIGALSDAAYRLWQTSILMAARDRTDGFVRADLALAQARKRPKVGRELIVSGLWHEPGHDCESCPEPKPDEIYVHDYLDHQQSRAQIEGRSAARSEAGKKGARARWER